MSQAIPRPMAASEAAAGSGTIANSATLPPLTVPDAKVASGTVADFTATPVKPGRKAASSA
jgi:hypothetical protein